MAQTISNGFGQTAHRHRAELPPVICLKAAVGKAAQRHCLVEHRIKHRREITG